MWHVNDSKYLCWLADWLIALGSHIEFIVGYCNPECGVVFHGSCGCVWNWGIVHEWPTHRESDENPLKFGVLHFQTNQERNLLRLNHLMWLRSKRVQELFCVQIRYGILYYSNQVHHIPVSFAQQHDPYNFWLVPGNIIRIPPAPSGFWLGWGQTYHRPKDTERKRTMTSIYEYHAWYS